MTLGTKTVTEVEEWASVKGDTPGFPRLVFGKVPEGKVVKNRVHLDLKANDMRAEVQRLKRLGATVLEERGRSEEGRDPEVDAWTVTQDPEGNEFCIG